MCIPKMLLSKKGFIVILFVKMQSNAFTHREIDRVYSHQSTLLPTHYPPSLFLFSSCPSSRSPVWCRRLSITGKTASNSGRYPSFFCVCSQARGPISVRLKPQLLTQLHTSCWLPSSACNRSFAFSFLQQPPPKPVNPCNRRPRGCHRLTLAGDIERAWTLKRSVLAENS